MISLAKLKYLMMDVRRWVRYRTTRRYHVVKTGLPPGYYDEDVLILHACMALLDRFVAWHGGEHDLEKFTERLREHPHGTSSQAHDQSEALAIWRWWKYQWPLDEARKELKYDADIETKILDDEQNMLRRLIEIRPGLWE